LEGTIRLEITPFCRPQLKQWIELLNKMLMGSITIEESCGHHLNPLMNLSMNKSETTRNNALKYREVKGNWAWDLL